MLAFCEISRTKNYRGREKIIHCLNTFIFDVGYLLNLLHLTELRLCLDMDLKMRQKPYISFAFSAFLLHSIRQSFQLQLQYLLQLQPFTIDCCADIWKAASTSCPCIENLATSAALVAQTQLAILSDDQKLARPICYSVPTLCCHLSVPQGIPVHTISAPTSPRKQEMDLLSRYSREVEEIPVWTESAPLLKITTPLDSETTCV